MCPKCEQITDKFIVFLPYPRPSRLSRVIPPELGDLDALDDIEIIGSNLQGKPSDA